MAREYKKGVYTLKEISELAMKKYPDRWVNLDSAYASVKTAARQLEINDINGKRKYKQIAAVEVARIFENLEKCNRRKKSGPKQADLFSLLPADESKEKQESTLNNYFNGIDPAELKAGPAEVLTIDEMPETIMPDGTKTTPPDWRKLKALETAADILKDALRIFIDCLMEYERGRG